MENYKEDTKKKGKEEGRRKRQSERMIKLLERQRKPENELA